MIDDKKIEEAAREAADLYEQDLPIMSYNEDTEVDGQHHFCQEFGAELFKDGAKWAIDEFLKDLWHPVWKKPEDNRYILWEEKYSGVKSTMFYNATEYNTCYDEPWDNKVASLNITRWLYIDDLLLKK